MKILKTILQSKIFLVISFVFIFVYIIIFTKFINYKSSYQDGYSKLTLKVIKYSKTNDKITVYFKGKEKIISNIYTNDLDISIGDTFIVEGDIESPSNNTVFNTFNYKNYLYNKKIYKTISINKITKIKNNKNIFNKIKDKIINICQKNEYLLLFITGDKSLLESDIYETYKNIGIAHLLAISGMHVSLFIKILDFLLKFLNRNIKHFIITVVIFFYTFVVSFTPSVLRVFIFFLLGLFNNKYQLNLSKLKRLYLCFIIMLLLNPFYIYEISFLYSFSVVFGIIFSSKYLCHSYFINILLISIIAMLFSLPITINLNYEINIMSLLANFLLVPFVTFIIYPLCLISFLCPKVLFILTFFTNIMETISNYLNKFSFLIVNIPKMNFVFILLYYMCLILFVYLNRKRFLFFILLIISLLKVIPKLDQNLYVIYFDVGQGDSSIIILPHKKNAILIDTGGSIYYNPSENIVLYLKSIGINKINIISTHGDNDHIGDALNVINKIKVENFIFNCGEYNDLENDIIETLKNKNIKYEKCIKNLNINGYNFKFLNTGIYNNENTNSSVIYFEYQKYKFLFMGDADIDREKDIIKKYNLTNIDFLKVGHHGSDTSSSKEFINKINPKYSFISVGKNNRYGHPKETVLETLKITKIYRTDEDGSIEIKIKSDGYSIETCSP